MEKAFTLDAKGSNTSLADTISKEMENVIMAFEVLPDKKSVCIGHQFVQCHMMFDEKMKDFRCKSRFVAAA